MVRQRIEDQDMTSRMTAAGTEAAARERRLAAREADPYACEKGQKTKDWQMLGQNRPTSTADRPEKVSSPGNGDEGIALQTRTSKDLLDGATTLHAIT